MIYCYQYQMTVIEDGVDKYTVYTGCFSNHDYLYKCKDILPKKDYFYALTLLPTVQSVP